MAEKMMLTEDQAIELFTFLITSARTQLDEPCLYASMRLITAAELLRNFIAEHTSPDAQKLLTTTVEKMEHAQINMNDVDTYTTTLDELCGMVAHYLVEQSDLAARNHDSAGR
jgi:hypothetical protein